MEYKGKYGEGYRNVAVNPYLLEELSQELPNKKSIPTQIQLHKSKPVDKILKPEEAALMLGVSYKTLWRWARKGKIKYIKLPSGHLRYYKKDIQKFIEQKK